MSSRESLGTFLRELRVRRGLSGVALAKQLGWVQSKVSRIETGRQVPTDDDILSWSTATQANDLVEHMLNLARDARAERVGWRPGSFEETQTETQRSLYGLAADVSVIRNLEIALVPGLLQTGDYARFRLAENIEFHGAPASDLESALIQRMQRQQVLYDSAKKFDFLISETACRTVLCPKEIMLAQIDRLINLLSMPNVEIGIIPSSVRMPIAPLHGFAMFGDTVLIETWAEERVLQNIAESEHFSRIFDEFKSVSRYGGEARRILDACVKGIAEMDSIS
ncbi:helix-turn-helix transcriptional regulator [Polymorphospora sp. NPDC050346]|uniref:helix-turn-helix domain-containing protein n=1 Tax=Polymorphospora sp. NPDC050346 TaxID=3155780 RepID=UPI0033F25BC2